MSERCPTCGSAVRVILERHFDPYPMDLNRRLVALEEQVVDLKWFARQQEQARDAR